MRFFFALTPDKPSRYMSSLYPQKIENDTIDFFKDQYFILAKKYNKTVNITSSISIYQSPFIIPSYYIKGDEGLIKKYVLSERLKGLKYISLYKYIDYELLDFILRSYNTWYFQGSIYIIF
ncbi:DUF4895 domain-containing protein [Marinitoga lauensis]|uniref:DUF4895 domain-containing protein n=1 Tax=Marinitoga lauensis TaxID=2201189 RepID=UPI001012205B|nr:DUF4895 domain-containing protein [Marinitoga lauensis]